MKKLVIFILLPILILAQNNSIKRDTSYTLYSAYQKYSQKYSFIQPVYPILPDDVNALRKITYVKYGEREMKLDLFFTNSSQSVRPVVVLVHGGGWKTGNKSLTYPLALEMASIGYVAASIEYRLSGEENYPAAINDVRNAVAWLKLNAAEYFIDTNKIILLGCSAGGQIAALSALMIADEEFSGINNSQETLSSVKAIINIDGLMDFLGKGSKEYDEVPDPKNPRAAHKWLGKSHLEEPELWKAASPLSYINKYSPPILFVNSSVPRFHAGRDEAVAKLIEYDIYYEIHTIEKTPHSFWLFHPWFKKTVAILKEFLQKTCE